LTKTIGDFFSEAIDRGSELDRLQKDIEINQITLNRELKKGERSYEEQKLIAEDINLSESVRLKAAANAQAILKSNVKLQTDQVDRELKLARLKTEANDTDRAAEEEIQDLLARKDEIEAKSIKKGLLLRNKANSIAKKAETDRLKAIDKESKAETKKLTDNKKEYTALIDARIEAIKLARQLELATIDETNEEKIAKEKAMLKEIGELRVDKAKTNGEDVATVKLENQIAEAEAAKEQQAVIDEGIKAKEQEQAAFKKQLVNDSLDVASQAGKALLAGAASRAAREKDIELANLDAKLQGGLISQQEFESQKLAIEQKAFNRKKKNDLAIIAIDLAKELSSIAVAAAGNPANAFTFGGAGVSQAAVLSGIAIARSGIQAGVVASQKFADGGMIHGASHAQGGVSVSVGGQGTIEAEGGEAIINKRSTSKHLGLLSAINQDMGGVALSSVGNPSASSLNAAFGNGGIATTAAAASGASIDLTDLETRIAAAVGNIQVQNVASETTGVANRVQQIEDSASF
jgi:hypothetical protein